MRPFFEVARNVLPEIRQLQRGAGVIGKLLALGVAVAAEIQHQAAHRIRRIHAVIEHSVPGGIALHALVLSKGPQQIAERLLRNILRANRFTQGNQHRMRRAALGRITQPQLFFPRIEQIERALAVGDLVAQIVRPAAVGIQIVEMLVQIASGAATRPR